MKLSEFTQGRDNNFNLLRIAAAFAVMVSHSFALTMGTGEAEPLRKSLGTTPGGIGVDVFFITSGFLVTSSLLTRRSALEFLWARFLRIYPALLVMLLLTVFGLGLFFTTLPAASYLSRSGTYLYLLKNSTLFSGVAYALPGVFETLPYKNAINGSLWTLPFEIMMYCMLVFIWLLLRMVPKQRPMMFKFAILFLAAGAAVIYLSGHFPSSGESSFTRLFYLFFIGAACYVMKDHVTLSRSFFILFVSSLAFAGMEKHVFFVIYNLVIAYVLFFVAYVPAGRLRGYNRLGDYSYGLYIYAFPIQQSVIALIPGISVLELLLVSFLITLALAALSWHFLEKHALKLKNYYVGYSRRLLGFFSKNISNRLG